MLQVVYDDVYMLDDEMKWKVLPPMPKPEFAWVVVNNSIVIVGGTTDKHPVTKKMTLVGEILQFQLDTLVWDLFIYLFVFYAFYRLQMSLYFRPVARPHMYIFFYFQYLAAIIELAATFLNTTSFH